MQMDLIKAEVRNNSSSLFSITGFTKQSGLGIPGGPQIDMQQLIDQMKNATPEERDAMMKHIQELYGKQPH